MQTYSDLHAYRLTPEQMATGEHMQYEFLITSFGATSHTAFIHEASFLRWLWERGLQCQNLDPGERAQIGGSYATQMHMNHDGFNALEPVIEAVTMSNGSWTQAKITEDPQTGLRTVHTLNPNVHTRPVMDSRLMRELRG